MSSKKNILLAGLALALIASPGMAQIDLTAQAKALEQAREKSNLTALSNLAAEFHQKFEADEVAVLRYLAAHPTEQRQFEKDGKTHYMVRLDAAGHPVYRVARNVESAKLIKVDSLYLGGSVGENITGQGLVAGVWEPGLPRPTHELLSGKITIEAGQVAGNKGDMDHASHVTGTFVGKELTASADPAKTDLAKRARGMAYNATARNWDAPDDQAEAAAAAVGNPVVLVSNHFVRRRQYPDGGAVEIRCL